MQRVKLTDDESCGRRLLITQLRCRRLSIGGLNWTLVTRAMMSSIEHS
jgi:hypothetical protein